MAETFPVGFARIDIRPNPGLAYKRERRGVLISSRNGVQPYWSGSLRTGRLLQAEYRDLYGALTNAIENNLRFDFVLPRFILPAAYTAETWPLVANPTIEAVTDLRTLSLAGLEVGMTLRRGDRFTILKGELRCYRMLAADVTVASATAQAISITPRLPIGVFEAADEVQFVDPPIRLAVLDPIDMPEEYTPTPVSFSVTETLA